MASYTETKRIAALHRTLWDVETADPGSIRAVIGFARTTIKSTEVVIISYKQCGAEVPADLYATITFWQEYIDWGAPIVAHWWGAEEELIP